MRARPPVIGKGVTGRDPIGDRHPVFQPIERPFDRHCFVTEGGAVGWADNIWDRLDFAPEAGDNSSLIGEHQFSSSS
jgi:hypothetical protein